MVKPVLAVDCDDVILAFNLSYSQFHNQHYGSAIQYEGIYTYDMNKLYGVPVPEKNRRVFEFCHGHHEDIPLIDGTLAALQALSDDYELRVVTSRCESLLEITDRYLQSRDIRHLFSELHFTNGFASKHPEKKITKLEVCEEIGAVALIEDAPGHANEVASGGIAVFMPDRPWNQVPVVPGVKRAWHWRDIVRELCP